MKTLLGKLDSVRRIKELGYGVATQARLTSYKFMGSVEKIFKNLPKPLEWRSFYNHESMGDVATLIKSSKGI